MLHARTGVPVARRRAFGRVARRWQAAVAPGVALLVACTFGMAAAPPGAAAVGSTPAVTGTVPTTTVLVPSVPNPVFGQSVTLSATVTVAPPDATEPSGAILFYDGANLLGTVAAVQGQASLTTSGLAFGPHLLSAYYAGDATLAPSASALVSLTVAKAATAVSISPSATASVVGQSVTLTASAAAVAPGSGVPGATIAILDGSTVLAAQAPVGGVVTYTTSQLGVGVHALTAAFAGGPNYLASTSPPLSYAVAPASSTTTLSLSDRTPKSGQPVTLTAKVAAVAPGTGTPTAPVLFSDGATALALVKPKGNKATYTTAMLGVGAHLLSATSTGSSSYLGSTSPAVSVTVSSCGCDWPEFRAGPDHLGTNPSETSLGVGNVGGLAPLWSDTTRGNVLSSPSVVGGIVYVGSSDGRIIAADAATGAPRWTLITGGGVHASPLVVGGVVYVGSDDGMFRALDALTGAVRWTIATGSVIDSAANTANGVVYFGGTDGKVYAVKAQTGAVIWTALTGYPVHASPTIDPTNGNVIVGSTNGKVYAYNLTTGSLAWSYQTLGSIAGTAALANGLVYVPCYDGHLYVIRADTGAPVWWAQTGALTESSPAVVNGVVYLGNNGGAVSAFNALTGAPIWSMNTGGEVHGSPAVANGVVYIGSAGGSLYALDAGTGATLWSYATGYPVTSSPSVVQGVVYVGGWDYKLHAFAVPAGSRHARPNLRHAF
jgi:outer membrane protein assembly factor BamB